MGSRISIKHNARHQTLMGTLMAVALIIVFMVGQHTEAVVLSWGVAVWWSWIALLQTIFVVIGAKRTIEYDSRDDLETFINRSQLHSILSRVFVTATLFFYNWYILGAVYLLSSIAFVNFMHDLKDRCKDILAETSQFTDDGE